LTFNGLHGAISQKIGFFNLSLIVVAAAVAVAVLVVVVAAAVHCYVYVIVFIVSFCEWLEPKPDRSHNRSFGHSLTLL
jgi:hypothetical protein